MNETETAAPRRRRARANYFARSLVRALDPAVGAAERAEERRAAVALVKRLPRGEGVGEMIAAQMTVVHDWAMGTLARAGEPRPDDWVTQRYLHRASQLFNVFVRQTEALAKCRREAQAAGAPQPSPQPSPAAREREPGEAAREVVHTWQEPEWSKKLDQGLWKGDPQIEAWLKQQAIEDPAFRNRLLAAARAAGA
jgi:hypothetical protein